MLGPGSVPGSVRAPRGRIGPHQRRRQEPPELCEPGAAGERWAARPHWTRLRCPLQALPQVPAPDVDPEGGSAHALSVPLAKRPRLARP